MDELEELSGVWQAMPRNNGAEMQAADDYFDKEIMPQDLQVFLAKYGALYQHKYRDMILTLGTSWQPLALSIAMLNPQRILILATQETLPLLQRLTEFLSLEQNMYSCKIVARSDAEQIYRAVWEFYRTNGGRACCMDITGGTKAMSSAAAMVGTALGMDILYIESRYLPVYRRPAPGSGRPEWLPNPLKFLKTIQNK